MILEAVSRRGSTIEVGEALGIHNGSEFDSSEDYLSSWTLTSWALLTFRFHAGSSDVLLPVQTLTEQDLNRECRR